MTNRSLSSRKPEPSTAQGSDAADSVNDAARRALIRRVAVGLPLILATVRGRRIWAQVQQAP